MDDRKRMELEVYWRRVMTATARHSLETVKADPALATLVAARVFREGDDIYFAAYHESGGYPFKIDAVAALNLASALLKAVEHVMPGTVSLLQDYAPPCQDRN